MSRRKRDSRESAGREDPPGVEAPDAWPPSAYPGHRRGRRRRQDPAVSRTVGHTVVRTVVRTVGEGGANRPGLSLVTVHLRGTFDLAGLA